MRKILLNIFLVLILISCTDSGKKSKGFKNIKSIVKIENISINRNKKNFDLNIKKFQIQIDSLLKKLKGNKYYFTLKSDTFSCVELKENKFKLDLFFQLYSDSLTKVIKNIFYVPNTQKMFRVYLVEAYYTSNYSLENKLKELKILMRDSIPCGNDCGYYFNERGLTTCHDYIMKYKNKIYWLNINYPYSRKEFRKFINCLRNNVDTTLFKAEIICFCGGECLDKNVP